MYRIHYKSFRNITLLARNLRKNQTSSEEFLWKILRRNNLSGYKFLRQHPVYYRIDKGWVEFFIADFYCAKLQLIIEVDGPIHLTVLSMILKGTIRYLARAFKLSELKMRNWMTQVL
jgi:very-short-patch-repair endonuclease